MISARHLVLIFRKGEEKTLLTFVTFGLLTEFHSVSTCKSHRLMVFRENHVFPHFLEKSNLFKGLFCQTCSK